MTKIHVMEPFACICMYLSSCNLKACYQVIQSSAQLANYCTGLCYRTYHKWEPDIHLWSTFS